MDDLQLAVETILSENGTRGGTATLEIVVGPEVLELSVGPIAIAPDADSEGVDDLRGRRLLTALVERVDVVERGGETWIRLEKPIVGGGRKLGVT
jgi:hypothetical protein